MPHRSGFQCGLCATRIHQALTVPVIEERLHQPCQQLTVEAQQRNNSRHQYTQSSAGWKKPRATFGATNVAAVYTKRVNEGTFQTFVKSACVKKAYDQPHEAHPSHYLWQKGEKVSCKQCGLTLHLDAQHRIILTGAIRRACKGAAISGSPPLPELFRKQAQKALNTPEEQTSSPKGL